MLHGLMSPDRVMHFQKHAKHSAGANQCRMTGLRITIKLASLQEQVWWMQNKFGSFLMTEFSFKKRELLQGNVGGYHRRKRVAHSKVS